MIVVVFRGGLSLICQRVKNVEENTRTQGKLALSGFFLSPKNERGGRDCRKAEHLKQRSKVTPSHHPLKNIKNNVLAHGPTASIDRLLFV